jgi:YgiT-type zinc finger domain-containing protein
MNRICREKPSTDAVPVGHRILRELEDKEVPVKCVICRQGETKAGTVTVTLQRGETTVIIKGVPAQVCENCGEYYLDENVTERIMAMGEEAVKKNVEVEILRYAA